MSKGSQYPPSGRRRVYSFPPFRFDPDSGEVHTRGRVVRCPVQSARALHILLKHAGEVVTREQLRLELWSDNINLASDEAINKAISHLRDILRDKSRHPMYIETLPKRGYRFVARVVSEAVDVMENEAPGGTDLPDPTTTSVVEAKPQPLQPVLSPEEIPDPLRTERPRKFVLWTAAIVCLAAICVAALAWKRHFKQPVSRQAAAGQNLRIGIAPFESTGRDADSLAESFRLDLTDELAQLPHLRVNAAHGTHLGADERKAMLALQADILIFGKLSTNAGPIELQLELARGNDATHLATLRYKVPKDQLTTLRDQIQKDLLEAFKVSSGGERPALGSTDNAQAYALSLQARGHLRQWNMSSWAQADSEFRKAIELDSGFARAYSGLAATLIAMAEHNSINAEQNYQEARKLAQKARALDPQSAEGYAELANIAYIHDWNFVGAEAGYRRAIELDPANSQHHIWLADLLCVQGHFAESIREVNLAHRLDPSWKAPYMAAMYIYSTAGQPERSIAVGNELIAADPKAAMIHHQIGWTYWYAGLYPRAIQEWRTTAQLEKDEDRLRQEDLGMQTLQSGGVKAYAEQRLKVIESGEQWKTANTDLVPSEWFIYAGQKDNAIAALNTQIELHDRAAREIAVDPAYKALRDDTRYQMLVRKMGLTLTTTLGRHAWHNAWD